MKKASLHSWPLATQSLYHKIDPAISLYILQRQFYVQIGIYYPPHTMLLTAQVSTFFNHTYFVPNIRNIPIERCWVSNKIIIYF